MIGNDNDVYSSVDLLHDKRTIPYTLIQIRFNMETKLLNPWALDAFGKIVSIEHAQKGENYSCPQCHEPLTFCKKGNGPHAHQDHFAHKPGGDCSFYSSHDPESEIHKLAKEAIYNILQSYIDNQREFPISWTCPECGCTFNGNLLKKAKTVEKEKQFKDRSDYSLSKQPDVSLVDENGKLIVAIEVVFTHDVEEEKLQFFIHNNVVLVKIFVQSAEDCNDLEQRLRTPDNVNLCFNKDCHCCQEQKINRKIFERKGKDQLGAVALYVMLTNPFSDERVFGLNFNAEDEEFAKYLAKRIWPGRLCSIKGKIYPYYAPVQQQIARKASFDPQRRGPLINYYEQKENRGDKSYLPTRKNYSGKK